MKPVPKFLLHRLRVRPRPREDLNLGLSGVLAALTTREARSNVAALLKSVSECRSPSAPSRVERPESLTANPA